MTPEVDEDDSSSAKHARGGSPGSDGGVLSPTAADGRGGRYDTSLGLLTKKFTVLVCKYVA